MRKLTKTFESVSSLRPGKSLFDLSYNKKFSCDMGELIPIACEEMVPGDHFTVGNQAIVRFQPLVAPIMHEINMYVHYFFVPYRLLWDLWEDFITGGKLGDDASVMPEWSPTNTAVGSLWDYMGFPTGVVPAGTLPIDMPRRAYNMVFNEFYRDETLQTEVALTNEAILLRNWEKDYFTSSLPWQQRGTSPALPITGTTTAVWPAATFNAGTGANAVTVDAAAQTLLYGNGAQGKANLEAVFANNTVDLSNATPFDIADLRLAVQIQRWMERNARGGVRYTEFLTNHFGVSPEDSRLQRPEYFGGTKAPIIISEVLQTSSTDVTTPQGNMAGHGVTLSEGFAGKYFAKEFGLMLGIMSVMPRSGYSQGVNRQWIRKSRYDFYMPQFANLSEQAILNAEICAKDADSTHNTGIFGYQGRYDEMRFKPNMICGDMRSVFDYWHLGRQFSPAAPPTLNESFIQCVPRKDIFAVQNVDGLLVEFGNAIHAVRPMPVTPEPGMMDHD